MNIRVGRRRGSRCVWSRFSEEEEEQERGRGFSGWEEQCIVQEKEVKEKWNRRGARRKRRRRRRIRCVWSRMRM